MEAEIAPINGSGLLTMPDEVWEVASRRADVIAPLARLSMISKQALDEASQKLGISRRHLYQLIKRYREGGWPGDGCGSHKTHLVLPCIAKSSRHATRGTFPRRRAIP